MVEIHQATVSMSATASLTIGAAEVTRALRPEGVTAADYAQLLAAVAEVVQAPPASASEVVDQIAEQAPTFADGLRALARVAEDKPALTNLLGTILLALSGIIVALIKSDSPPVVVPAPTVVVQEQPPPALSEDQITAIVEKAMRRQRELDQRGESAHADGAQRGDEEHGHRHHHDGDEAGADDGS